MSIPLEGKVALVTGASRHIGRAIALRLAEEGMRLVLAARNFHDLEHVAGEVERRGGEAEVARCDLTESETPLMLAGLTQKRFGGLDLLVNNAGGGEMFPLDQASAEHLDEVLNLNLRALIQLCRACQPLICAPPGGTIVNISSMAGVHCSPGASAYSAAKAGILGWTESLFEELRQKGVKVSAICPGWVDNQGRWDDLGMSPEDVADAVHYVAAASPRCCPIRIHLRDQREPPH